MRHTNLAHISGTASAYPGEVRGEGLPVSVEWPRRRTLEGDAFASQGLQLGVAWLTQTQARPSPDPAQPSLPQLAMARLGFLALLGPAEPSLARLSFAFPCPVRVDLAVLLAGV